MYPAFDRACYNLGTVLYADACARQEALLAGSGAQQQQQGGEVPRPPPAAGGAAAREAERTVRSAFAHSAQYIALAYCLQPGRQVYRDSLSAVQRLLPLPALRASALAVLDPSGATAYPGAAASSEAWVRCWVVLDTAGLRAARPPAAEAAGLAPTPPAVALGLAEMTDATTCADPSLPEGHGVWVGLHDHPAGAYFVADSQEEAEGWADALRLLLHAQRGSAGLAPLQTALSGAGRRSLQLPG